MLNLSVSGNPALFLCTFWAADARRKDLKNSARTAEYIKLAHHQKQYVSLRTAGQPRSDFLLLSNRSLRPSSS